MHSRGRGGGAYLRPGLDHAVVGQSVGRRALGRGDAGRSMARQRPGGRDRHRPGYRRRGTGPWVVGGVGLDRQGQDRGRADGPSAEGAGTPVTQVLDQFFSRADLDLAEPLGEAEW